MGSDQNAEDRLQSSDPGEANGEQDYKVVKLPPVFSQGSVLRACLQNIVNDSVQSASISCCCGCVNAIPPWRP